MDANDYQQQAARTLIDAPDNEYTATELWLALELAQAAGAVIDHVKKGVFHRHGADQEAIAAGVRHIRACVSALKIADESDRIVLLSPDQIMLIWNALGLAGEAIARQRPIDQDATVKELGDGWWYSAALCTKLGIPLSEVMEQNIAKLKRRFPDGWSTERSINRQENVPVPAPTSAAAQRDEVDNAN